MTIRTSLTSLFLAGLFVVNVQAEVQKAGAEVGKWTQDYEAALKVAAEKKLPVMLNFTGSDWCHWCKIMDEQVFAQDDWKTFAAENAVLVTLDFPKDKSIVPEGFAERNAKLQGEFGVRGYPTFIVLDSDGKTRLGQLGASKDASPEKFIKQFKQATQLSASNVAEFVKANPTKEADFTAAVKELKDSRKALEDWIATGPQQTEENNEKFAAFKSRIEKAGKSVEDMLAPEKDA